MARSDTMRTSFAKCRCVEWPGWRAQEASRSDLDPREVRVLESRELLRSLNGCCRFSCFLAATLSVAAHDATDAKHPLFLNYDFHIVHEPLQVPDVYFHKFDFMTDDFQNHRQTYHAMVNFMDDVVGNITAILKAKGMWENTFIALQSDNGGPSFDGSSHTANNFPLRGTKMHNFEGGVRVNGFVSGGIIPPAMRGSVLNGFVHACDWYATFCALAGVDKFDDRAAAAGLPEVDGLDMVPYFTGAVKESPRTFIYGDVDMVISGEWKLINATDAGACWAGPRYPNGTTSPDCKSTDCANGCLFNIFEDPTEHRNLIATNPSKAAEMRALLAKLDKTFFSPIRGAADPKACDQSERNGNFWGPWLQ